MENNTNKTRTKKGLNPSLIRLLSEFDPSFIRF